MRKLHKLSWWNEIEFKEKKPLKWGEKKNRHGDSTVRYGYHENGARTHLSAMPGPSSSTP